MISGGSLETSYRAVQLHWHWGKNGGPGSEHTIDGEQYPMETSSSVNEKYEPIIRSLGNIKQSGFNVSLSGLSLDMLIPEEEDMTIYYRYEGSLTIPGCSEAVVWTVFEHTVPLSEAQLSAFSALQFSNGEPMTGTFRPVQPLNSRKVYRSGSGAVLASTILLVISVMASTGL
ncbi:hypothetical protein SKAU_G00083890 [Synaphobranchus kaupii]|uniref:Carbonic anhydrase 4 n=1 Tax=Synaphobranchus kaupii TaxID=118154 RepID=A0A9Q1FW86_SYNKA|nr:hypothetical protein SKAU_G00083890 [Synaphobranchus kaupii]